MPEEEKEEVGVDCRKYIAVIDRRVCGGEDPVAGIVGGAGDGIIPHKKSYEARANLPDRQSHPHEAVPAINSTAAA
jgi:hypothetical protein